MAWLVVVPWGGHGGRCLGRDEAAAMMIPRVSSQLCALTAVPACYVLCRHLQTCIQHCHPQGAVQSARSREQQHFRHLCASGLLRRPGVLIRPQSPTIR